MNKRQLALSIIASFVLSLLFQAPSRAETPVQQKSGAQSPAAPVPAPEEVLGFRPGDDRKLASWASVVEYFRRLDAASDRLKFEELGKTTMGAPFVMATISAPENLRRLNEYKEIQRLLADPRTLGANADRKAQRLIARGKTIVLITCGIHSTEVGSYLSSMLIAHRLASSDDAEVQGILRNTIILLVPSLNPDGVDIVKNWYDKTLGTPFEGTDPPELYHKYTGHDNNRDWYAFTQKETQLTVDKIHNVWHPQIVHDIHQQSSNGSRLFLPPYMQPVEPNVPKQIVEGYTELGRAMADEMRAAGFKGITWDSTYDAWTPARAYSHYHGGVRILSETASAKLATPITVKFDDLRAGQNYDPRKASANFPDVWQGGEWRLRDITNYMTTAAFSLLRHAAQNREHWLERFYEIGKEAVRPRKNGELFGFVIPYGTRYGFLQEILERGGVKIDSTGSFIADGVRYPDNSLVVRIAQPYGSFAKAILEAQHYPNLRDASGNPIAPYDVTAHTLPLLLEVKTQPIFSPFRLTRPKTLHVNAGGCAILPPSRLAIYKSHVPSMDEGWTRWVLENQWEPPDPGKAFCAPRFIALIDDGIRKGSLQDSADVILFPDQSPRAILEGQRKGAMPEEYTGGVGAEGVKRLREFVEQGGTLVFLNRASDFAIEQFKLPVRDVTEGLKRTEFYVPGSILRIELDTSHPITKGMPKESIAWVENSPIFEIKPDPAALARVRVIARYPEAADPLLSGWLLGSERIRGKAALVEVGLGKGRIYLFGFRPQYRGQSLATYPLLFNAIAPTK
ncbi:MAG TPA: M14 metallopeptidase family protein [Pyrinomonadaceae bacterium]